MNTLYHKDTLSHTGTPHNTSLRFSLLIFLIIILLAKFARENQKFIMFEDWNKISTGLFSV